MASKRKSKRHKGVVLMAPYYDKKGALRVWWRARYYDPERLPLKKFKFELLPADLTTKEQRAAWAATKAGELAKRRVEIALGANQAQGKLLADAVEVYFEDHKRLGKETIVELRSMTAKFLGWAAREGLKSCDNLTRPLLVTYATALKNEPKRSALKGKKVGRGKRVSTDKLRSPVRVNTEMRKTGTVLRHLIKKHQFFPRLSREDVSVAFEPLDVAKERIEFLPAHECQKLLEACLRHDADLMKSREDEERLRREARALGITRKAMAEHGPEGSTPRYEAIAPFTAFVLLSGVRRGEALSLDWKRVDLDALDSEGRRVGEIHLEGKINKTKTNRTIDLAVSPALRSLLAAMRLASGGEGSVFGLTDGLAGAAVKRLKTEYGAPAKFGWQALRRTAATYLTCSPGIFGGASAYRSGQQLGHSTAVAEKHYLGLVRGISRDARTVEAAMQIEELMERIVARIQAPVVRQAVAP